MAIAAKEHGINRRFWNIILHGYDTGYVLKSSKCEPHSAAWVDMWATYSLSKRLPGLVWNYCWRWIVLVKLILCLSFLTDWLALCGVGFKSVVIVMLMVVLELKFFIIMHLRVLACMSVRMWKCAKRGSFPQGNSFLWRDDTGYYLSFCIDSL